MSLFKARNWWSTTSGCEEFHDIGSLCVANVDNSPSGHDKIVVGSFKGLVRIYLPRPQEYDPDHLILERDMGAPVLQVAVGRFVQGSQALHLALLHPRELAIHTLTSHQSEEGVQHTLTLVYRHTLQRTAANMTWGPFGAAKDVDHVCVQSMDGQLSFFHQENTAFSCFLPDFLLPGPLRFLPRTDSLVTTNSARMLQTFRYQSLSVATSSRQDEREAQPSGGKKVTADWSVNLAEHVIDIRVVTVPGCPSHILVLGERSVFCFCDNGKMRFMKKLELSPSCIHPYGIIPPQTGEEGEGVLQYLLTSHTNQLMVFQDSSLVWAARLDHPPTDITVANFKELSGVVVALDELGHLTCCYLGTDPSIFSSSSTASRELNYEELDREMKELQHIIRESEREGVPLQSQEGSLVVHTEVEPQARVVDLGEEEEEEGEKGAEQKIQKCVEVRVHTLSASNAILKDVTVNIVSTLPLTTHPSHYHLDEVTSSTPSQPHTVTVVCTPTLLPLSHTITISATYTTFNGLPRVSEKVVELPLSLYCQPCEPARAAQYKVTVDTNHPVVSLRALFPSLLPVEEEGGPQNAMGFRLLAGPEVTIVASKSSGRYRIQSESFPAIAGFLEELLTRLACYHTKQEPQFQASYTSPLPLTEYFEIIEQHFKLRMNIGHCQEWLSRHAQQFRSIQKRLLSRFKDKTPVGLAHLDTLLDGTYMQLIALGEKNELFQLEMQECSNQLSCATRLINTLLRLTVHMSDEDFAVLHSTLSPVVNPDSEQGWEEQTDASISHLLRTTLAKSTKDQSVVLSAVELPADSQKLKRHIALLCDRICKGGSLGGTRKEATQSLSPQHEGGGRGRPSKPEVLSRLPVNHSVKKKPFLPALVEQREPSAHTSGSMLSEL